MLKKITVEDRREILLAELRKLPEAKWTQGSIGVPRGKDERRERVCAIGLIFQLWPESINWANPSHDSHWNSAAALVGLDAPSTIYRANDECHGPQEVADKLVHAGIKAIVNYAPISLNVPNNVKVQYIDPSAHLQRMTYYL